MQKLPVAIALLSLVAVTAVAKTKIDEKARGSEPSPSVADGRQMSLNEPTSQKSSAEARSVFKNPIPKDIREKMQAAMAPYSEAQKAAHQLMRDGKVKQAEVECRRAIVLAPRVNGKPWLSDEMQLLGDILLAQGRNQEALECYLRIVTSSKPDDPKHPRPNIGAALAYCRLGDFEMAKKYSPQHDSPVYHKAWPGGIEAFEASLLYSRAGEENSYGNDRGTVFYLKQAEKLAPTKWQIVDRIGQSLEYLNRPDDAVPYYRRAMELGGAKVSYEHRMLVEMFDLRKKQQQQKAAK